MIVTRRYAEKGFLFPVGAEITLDAPSAASYLRRHRGRLEIVIVDEEKDEPKPPVRPAATDRMARVKDTT
jgi:hypothetical protein